MWVLVFECGRLGQKLKKMPKIQNSDEDPFEFNNVDKAIDKSLELASADLTFDSDSAQSRSMAYTYYQLGEAHFQAQDYISALKFFKKAANIYRQENWKPVLQPILERVAECANHVSSSEDEIESKLELLSLGDKESLDDAFREL